MDLGGRLDMKDKLGLSSWVADGPFTETEKIGRGSGWRGNPTIYGIWMKKLDLERLYVSPKATQKFVTVLGLELYLPKTAELRFQPI